MGAIYLDFIQGRDGAVTRSLGGVCTNIATHLARAGLEVEFATMLEPGSSGDELAEQLAARGIRVTALREAGAVGCYRVFVGGDEPKTLEVTHPAARVPAELISTLERRIAETGSPAFLVLELGVPRPLVDAALAAARASGVRCVGVPTRIDTIADWRRLLAGVDLLILNRYEAASILGIEAVGEQDAVEASAALQRMGAGSVVLTFGSAGALSLEAARSHWHAPPHVAVVSALGAGDALAAGVVAGLAGGLRLANAVDAAMPQVARTLATLEATPHASSD